MDSLIWASLSGVTRAFPFVRADFNGTCGVVTSEGEVDETSISSSLLDPESDDMFSTLNEGRIYC